MTQDKTIEIHLLDYVLIVFRQRWRIIRNMAMTALAIFLLTFLLPKKYTAVTTLMPPAEQDGFSMSNVLAEVNVPGVSVPGKATPADVFLELLRSRSVGERVLLRTFAFKKDSLRLLEMLGYENMEDGLLAMSERATFVLSKKGFITITANMNSAQLAADVANAYVEELDQVYQSKSVSRAKNSRVYIESQLMETEARMKQVNEQLAAFQSGHRAVALEEQMRAAIQQAGELKGQIIARQVQIGMMQQSMKPENPVLIRAQNEVRELQKRYSAVQYGEQGAENADFYPAFVDAPRVGIQLAELLREVKVQETVWELLNQQYYQARIEEARDTPTVQVLDAAVAPLYPSSPRRIMLAMVFALIAAFFTLFRIFAQVYEQNLQQRPQEKAKWVELGQGLREDGRRIRRWLRLKRR